MKSHRHFGAEHLNEGGLEEKGVYPEVWRVGESPRGRGGVWSEWERLERAPQGLEGVRQGGQRRRWWSCAGTCFTSTDS